jgi:hypothetical protein
MMNNPITITTHFHHATGWRMIVTPYWRVRLLPDRLENFQQGRNLTLQHNDVKVSFVFSSHQSNRQGSAGWSVRLPTYGGVIIPNIRRMECLLAGSLQTCPLPIVSVYCHRQSCPLGMPIGIIENDTFQVVNQPSILTNITDGGRRVGDITAERITGRCWPAAH